MRPDFERSEGVLAVDNVSYCSFWACTQHIPLNLVYKNPARTSTDSMEIENIERCKADLRNSVLSLFKHVSLLI